MLHRLLRRDVQMPSPDARVNLPASQRPERGMRAGRRSVQIGALGDAPCARTQASTRAQPVRGLAYVE